MSTKKKEEKETIEVVLGTQYGSDFAYLSRGEVDPRRFTKLNDTEAYCIAYFQNVPSHQGGDYARSFMQEFMNLKMSVDGWRAGQGIRIISASKGAPTVKDYKKPGIIGRLITERDWKEKARAEGAEVE